MINGVHFCLTKKDKSENTIARILQRRSERGSRKTLKQQRTFGSNTLVLTTKNKKTKRGCLILKILVFNLNFILKESLLFIMDLWMNVMHVLDAMHIGMMNV